MKALEYVKEHIKEIEQDSLLDRRFTKRFIDFLPTNEWNDFGFEYTGKDTYIPKEWTEENIIEQLKRMLSLVLKKQQIIEV